MDGRPFFIRGAAGTTRLRELKDLGANTVRTYGSDPGPVLAEAERVGLKVIVGLWLEPPRRGFDYADPAAVTAQLDRLRAEAQRYKDHPALLMWGIGNEVEAELTDSARVWPAIEDAARMVKSVDPNHPTMAVAVGGAGLVAALGHHVEEPVGAEEVFAAAAEGRIGQIDRAVFVPREHAVAREILEPAAQSGAFWKL